ncbi:MAG: DUF4160 domain-containing protein [Verrucomicrobiae bacterium]|nr:DUF4160 domain-containing protein [Verrucomicrobiae bacterium]
MPTVFIQNGYRVSFYSYDLAERMHVHVFKDRHECKVWLDDLAVAFNHGFNAREIAEIRRMIAERRAEIVERWLEHGRHGN